MAINTLKDLQRLNKSYEYVNLHRFGTNYYCISYRDKSRVFFTAKTIKQFVFSLRKLLNISRKEYIVLVVNENVYDKLQCYTHSYVYTVQELFRKEKVIVDKIRNGNIYTFFNLDKYKGIMV